MKNNVLILFTFFVILLAVISSCNNNSDTPRADSQTGFSSTSTGPEKSPTDNHQPSDTKTTKPRPATDQIATTSKLEGGWISDSDATFQIQFKSNEYIEYNNGKVVRKGTYKLTDCKHIGCADCKPMPTCLILKIDGKEICQSVLMADGVDLKLSAAGQTKSLEFHRN